MSSHRQTLFHFLTRSAIPAFPIDRRTLSVPLKSGANTRSDGYPSESAVVSDNLWELSYREITTRFAKVLGETVSVPIYSQPSFVRGEETVKARVLDHVIKRVRWALAAARAPISADVADSGALPESNVRPDLAGYVQTRNGPVVRIPGDIKCSWKWSSSWRHTIEAVQEGEFAAVVAQINYYMLIATSRYGYILTDKEVVLFRKENDGYAKEIQMTRGFPLTTHDTHGNYSQTRGEVTALLALWYVHMLASVDDHWSIQTHSDRSEDDSGGSNFDPQAEAASRKSKARKSNASRKK